MDGQLPTLSSGVTCLDDADAPTALYRVVGRHLADERGPAYWIDACNRAAPAAIERHVPRRGRDALRITRAFTGYQHHELVRSLPGTIRETATLVVAPAVGALYADDDVPESEADALFASALELLGAVATAVDVPVLVTAGATPYADDVREAADRALDAVATDVGLRIEGATFASDVYWDRWGFQTTIPYWVELLGTIGTARPADFAGVRGGDGPTRNGIREGRDGREGSGYANVPGTETGTGTGTGSEV
jgi:hypothetical protein